MSIEKKSKRFDEALAIAKECITHVHDDAVKKYIFSMFPELKENEDERIKGAIIHFISHTPTVPKGVIGKKTMLAWLEKRGEFVENNKDDADIDKQNESAESCDSLNIKKKFPADEQRDFGYSDEPDVKVEPKFHEGDWIAYKEIYIAKILSVNANIYKIEFTDGIKCSSHIDYVDRHFHLWSIKDASDGDVLEFGDHGRLVVGMVSCVNKITGKVDVNCLLENNNFKVGNYYNLDTIKPHPAAKEERDLLFQKMREAGYTFDFEKKELKKIEPKFHEGDFIADTYCRGKVVVLTDDAYLLDTGQGIPFSCEDNVHLWTIEDANDGDVFCTDTGNLFIFKEKKEDVIYDYCGFYNGIFFAHSGSPNGIMTRSSYDGYKPATKEQRDTLFVKMKEAGYEWDAEKKELKKIEQKPADKVEPKFHEGDWTVSDLDGKARQISEVHFDEYNSYYVVNGKSVNLEEYDRIHHLWTIQDAKDGDVLRIKNLTFIFQEITNNNACHKDAAVAYCSYEDNDDSFGVCGPDCITDLEIITPATKEERDALFVKMKEAGYVWNAEQKKLEKIDTYCQDNCKGFQETGRCFCDGECKAKKEHKQNLQDNSFRRMFEQKPAELNENKRLYTMNVYYPNCCLEVKEAIEQGIACCKTEKKPILINLNGIYLRITPSSTTENVMNEYNKCARGKEYLYQRKNEHYKPVE